MRIIYIRGSRSFSFTDYLPVRTDEDVEDKVQRKLNRDDRYIANGINETQRRNKNIGTLVGAVAGRALGGNLIGTAASALVGRSIGKNLGSRKYYNATLDRNQREMEYRRKAQREKRFYNSIGLK